MRRRTVSAQHAAPSSLPKHLRPEDVAKYTPRHAPKHAKSTSSRFSFLASPRTIVAAAAVVMAVGVGALTASHQIHPVDDTTTALANTSESIAFSQQSFENTTSWDQVEGFLGVVEDGMPLDADVAFDLANNPKDYTARMVNRIQYGVMEGGCEPMSLAMVLESMGYPVDAEVLVDNYLEVDGNFATGYADSPYGMGGGYPPGIVKAANGYLADQGTALRAHDLTGTPFAGLVRIVQAGYPVLVWSTMGNEQPVYDGTFDGDAEWYINEHCVVVYGISENTVLVSDPLDGLVERDYQQFSDVYDSCGRMSVLIR